MNTKFLLEDGMCTAIDIERKSCLYPALGSFNAPFKGEGIENYNWTSLIVLYPDEKRMAIGKKMIDLTPTEFTIVRTLKEKQGRAVSRNELMDDIWGIDYLGNPKIVDVNMRRLRKKIEDNPSKPSWIKTVWGYGYKWCNNYK
ncbi:winged helix-turn-helix domain-containing protein [Chengkuizengella axinellae]|uniref:Winged helix-turn-helix domain-containing protein n=1 Tax=Chengkuizengella axinellae TaxID=3064388 RepID=A0ABT9J2X0_9BACL|nr:winged helix-turn-helix domain-containing protein [Chengkuizengella sp. 2205SS18-9]MDP5275964.1 winged helix-turn-helix domain-containing protein [Chengkuizengella sp. 2205SS18-9]